MDVLLLGADSYGTLAATRCYARQGIKVSVADQNRSARALFSTVDGEEIDAPAGTIVFVRDPALRRAARATADDTAIFMVGGAAGVPYAVSRWETPLP